MCVVVAKLCPSRWSAVTTKEKLKQALLTLGAQQDFTKVRISTLCQKVGIERKLFYYYFTDKYALLAAVYQQALTADFGVATTSKQNWTQHATQLLTRYQNQRYFYQHCLFSDNGTWNQVFTAHMQQLFTKLFVGLSPTNQQQDVGFDAAFYANGWTGIIRNWVQADFPQAPQQLVAQFYLLIRFTKENSANWPGVTQNDDFG